MKKLNIRLSNLKDCQGAEDIGRAKLVLSVRLSDVTIMQKRQAKLRCLLSATQRRCVSTWRHYSCCTQGIVIWSYAHNDPFPCQEGGLRGNHIHSESRVVHCKPINNLCPGRIVCKHTIPMRSRLELLLRELDLSICRVHDFCWGTVIYSISPLFLKMFFILYIDKMIRNCLHNRPWYFDIYLNNYLPLLYLKFADVKVPNAVMW